MKNRLALKLTLAALIALVVIVVIWRFDLVHSLNFYAVRKYIISYGKFAVLIFILFFAIRTIFLIETALLLPPE